MLLNESYRLDAAEKLELMTVASVPHMEQDNRDDVIDSYQAMSNDIIDADEVYDDFSALEDLRRIFKNS